MNWDESQKLIDRVITDLSKEEKFSKIQKEMSYWDIKALEDKIEQEEEFALEAEFGSNWRDEFNY
jgi:hypothetical protein